MANRLTPTGSIAPFLVGVITPAGMTVDFLRDGETYKRRDRISHNVCAVHSLAVHLCAGMRCLQLRGTSYYVVARAEEEGARDTGARRIDISFVPTGNSFFFFLSTRNAECKDVIGI